MPFGPIIVVSVSIRVGENKYLELVKYFKPLNSAQDFSLNCGIAISAIDQV